MTSLVYTLDDRLIPYKGRQKHSIPFVRKMINVVDVDSDDGGVIGGLNELAIAKLLMRNPQKNVVRVLKISTKTKIPYIDYQKLDIYKDLNKKLKKDLNKKLKSVRRDIKTGLSNLHKLNIIYIDLKSDHSNIGYDSVSKEWRIFDFDASGICDKTRLKWKRKPLPWAAYNYVIDNCKKNALITAPWGKNSKFSKKKTSIIKKICKKKSLTKFDEIIYFAVFGDILYP
jgi:serine/threonine protein kinase